MKVQKCFCCIPIEKAITLLGFLLLIGLLSQLLKFNPFLLVTNLATVTAFNSMYQTDTEQHRRYFFYSFSVYEVTVYVFSMFVIVNMDSERAIIDRCLEIQEDNGSLKAAGYRDIEECKAQTASILQYAIWVISIAYSLLLWHLARVVYTYW